MTIVAASRTSYSSLRKEGGVFVKQFQRLINYYLNWFFELTEAGRNRRVLMLIFMLHALAFLFSLRAYPLDEWGRQFSFLFKHLLVPEYQKQALGAIQQFVIFVVQAIFGLQTLRYMPVVILPFFFALEAAARYLDDIFELHRVDIARKFINQVALLGNSEHIRIREGSIASEDEDSPIYKIGGPGKVEVELDSVALFEKLDGRPNVIGPTVAGKAKLEGFERFRKAIDLRDQFPDPLKVTSRSLDGIPVSAVDVRMLYSIWRNNQPASIEHPYPFDSEAVKTLIYSQASRVNIRGQNPSDIEEEWAGAVPIRGELGGFMSKHHLVEYLASIGTPEVEQARQREGEIYKVKNSVIPEENSGHSQPEPKLPYFQSRYRISSLFSQFAREFTDKARKRGVELRWVGIGTWKAPSDIVPERHLEAWQLSLENLARGNEDALKDLRQEICAQKTISQIQDVPLARFRNNSNKDHQYREKDLLIAYREQLIEVVELLRKSKKVVPGSIYLAIDYLDKGLGYHWVH